MRYKLERALTPFFDRLVSSNTKSVEMRYKLERALTRFETLDLVIEHWSRNEV